MPIYGHTPDCFPNGLCWCREEYSVEPIINDVVQLLEKMCLSQPEFEMVGKVDDESVVGLVYRNQAFFVVVEEV